MKIDKKIKMVEEAKGDTSVWTGQRGNSRHRDEPFAPKLSYAKKWGLGLNYLFLFLASLYLIEQFCSIHVLSWLTERIALLREVCRPCVWGTYVAFGLVVVVLIIHHWIWHELVVHNERLEDHSEVESIFIEVYTVEPRLTDPKKPDNYSDKKKQLEEEVERLKALGRKGWTEYQVLSLNQLLVDFLKEDDLIGRAKSSLEDLQEYTAYSTYRHDPEHYSDWKERVSKAIANINKDEENKCKRDEAAETLRGELRTLLEHVADYGRYWAEGAVVIRGLMRCGVMAIPVLLAMGLLPILHPAGSGILYIYNWGLLGISGSITAVMLKLHKADLLYVGSTKGKEALWRAILGAALGLVAGVLLYSMVAGGILSGSAFPSDNAFPKISSEVSAEKLTPKLLDTARSVFWGIASGFSFEWVFDRLRSVKAGES